MRWVNELSGWLLYFEDPIYENGPPNIYAGFQYGILLLLVCLHLCNWSHYFRVSWFYVGQLFNADTIRFEFALVELIFYIIMSTRFRVYC